LKSFAIVILLFLFGSPAFSQDTVKADTVLKMTDREKTDCSKFRRMEGKDRYDQFCKISHLFPTGKYILLENNTLKLEEDSVTFYMSVKQLTDLLGKPASTKKWLVYVLTPDQCSVQFAKTKSGGVCFISYTNCQDKN
jgi:hypothetical protein